MRIGYEQPVDEDESGRSTAEAITTRKITASEGTDKDPEDA